MEELGQIIYVISSNSKHYYSIQYNQELFYDRNKIVKLQWNLKNSGGKGAKGKKK